MDEPKYNISAEEIASLLDTLDEEPADFCAELEEEARNLLHENPGMDREKWMRKLMEQYPIEIVDALGADEDEVYAALSDWWDSEDYEDTETGECHTFKDWAEYFATDRSVELYDRLAEAQGEIRRFEARKPQNHTNPQPSAQSPAEGQI